MSDRSTWRKAATQFAVLSLFFTTFAVAIAAAPASAATLNVSYTLEGCNLDHGGTIDAITHICTDSAYTTGNLGKSWAELDKVPMRVTLTNNSGTTQTGDFAVAGDYKNTAGSATGWDQISTLTLASTADASCPAVTSSGTQTITPPGGGVGGANQTIYRMITATIPAGLTCVYDYTMRLALGAHNFSGSSLQGNLWNDNLESGSVGQKRVSIPVAEIAPQQFSKVMTASKGSSVVWAIQKNSDTTDVNFSNTCSGTASRVSDPINVTVSWTKITTQSGVTTIVTTYTLTNPAHLAVVATVTDTIYEGTAQTTSVGTVEPLTFNLDPLETESQTATTTTSSTATHFNDVATAAYTVDGDPVGTLTRTSGADLTVNPPTSGATAVISDSETLTPNNVGIGFRVTAVNDASGTFSGGYTPGASADVVTSLDWTSATQSDSGSVTFTKQIVLDPGAFAANATLSDTATVTPDGQTATSAGPVETTISVSAIVDLTVSKTIPFVLGTGETVSFTFNLFENGADPTIVTPIDSKTITFNATDGGTGNPKTATFTGLDPNTDYDLYEVVPPGWADPGKIDVKTASLPTCTNTQGLTNSFAPASADASKVADPASGTAGWVFTLKKDSTTIATGTSAADGTVSWDLTSTVAVEALATADITEEGNYSITETTQAGWDVTDVTSTGTGTATPDKANAKCTFTVNFPADFSKTFSCQFTNVERGTVKVSKTENGGNTFTHNYQFTLTGGPDNVNITKTAPTDFVNGALDFGSLKPGTYTLCEGPLPAGFSTTLGTVDPNTGLACVTFTLAAGEDKAFNIDNTFPQGGQRTIGYWRNWSTCTGGNQVQVAKKNGFALLDDFLGTPATKLGNLQLSTCTQAVNILSKKTITGVKKASDPIFQMAAQLLGAKLNVAAGAGTCSAANTAIASADQLLKDIGFNGITYSATNTQKNTARSLATTLDQYNNGLLC